jgi:NAD(P)-dependent dehydrogenase (short-subunit alcohol dehydrogenase family)
VPPEGVGSAVAGRFAEAGATVVVHHGRNADGARRVAERLERITDVAVVRPTSPTRPP